MGCIEGDNGATADQTDLPTQGQTQSLADEGDVGDGAVSDAGAPVPDETPRTFDRWRRDSALGAVGTGVARGLQAVFAPPADEVVIVASVPGDPPGEDERIRVILDPDDPTKSVAIVPEGKDVAPPPPS